MPRQWRVSITSVLNRKNGFANGKIGAKVAVPKRHEKAAFVPKFLSVLKTLLWLKYFLYKNIFLFFRESFVITFKKPRLYWHPFFSSGVKLRSI